MNAHSDMRRLRAVTAGESLDGEQEDEPPKPRVETSEAGLFYIGTKLDPQTGVTTELPPVWLCDWVEILGRGADEAGDHYRILRWNSRGVRQEQQYALPLGKVGDRESWAAMRSKGLAMSSNRRNLERLADWLMQEGSDLMHSVSHRGGWNLGAYVLPSGEIIGAPSRPMFYNGDRSHAQAYQARGSVEGWRDSVARLSRGNTRPMLAIGAALAAPLLHLVGQESGGFHLFGPSGCGKTTSANVGASVWGNPKEQVLNWDATALALANAAAARNDGLMLLDEMGQGNPEAVSMAAYRLFNGTGKMQGAKEGGNREMHRWRILALSTGEIDLSSFMSGGGRRVRAGQEVRLASLPADAGGGMGAFECLHGLPDANHLAKALDDATQSCNGTVGRAFVAAVSGRSSEVRDRLKHAIAKLWEALHGSASGQVRRVAARFAVTGEALELASSLQLTGWGTGEGEAAILRCFHAWLDRYGLGNREESQVIEQAEGWFAAHTWGRFIDWNEASGDRDPTLKDVAGYRRRLSGGEMVWLVYPHVFSDEIAAGFDKVYSAKVLAKAGMLEIGADGKATTKHRPPGHHSSPRFYKFVSDVRTDD